MNSPIRRVWIEEGQPDSAALSLDRVLRIRAGDPKYVRYLVELAEPMATPRIELTKIGRWIERLPDLRLDGAPATSKALAGRLGSLSVFKDKVLYVRREPLRPMGDDGGDRPPFSRHGSFCRDP